jgi:hypothetical protein
MSLQVHSLVTGPPLGRLCKRGLRVRDRSAEGSFGGIQGAAGDVGQNHRAGTYKR